MMFDSAYSSHCDTQHNSVQNGEVEDGIDNNPEPSCSCRVFYLKKKAVLQVQTICDYSSTPVLSCPRKC